MVQSPKFIQVFQVYHDLDLVSLLNLNTEILLFRVLSSSTYVLNYFKFFYSTMNFLQTEKLF